jgi:hypothetical protein
MSLDPLACRNARPSARPMGRTILALAVLAAGMPAAAAPTYAERMHLRAVESFRSGRFPEAYGRFIDLADAGHPASARYALLMCEHGLALFGKDWDCAPHQVEDWTQAASASAKTSVRGRSGTP